MREPAELDAEAILTTLNAHGVRYVVVGGFAALLHGGAHVTFDVDVTPATTPDNLDRLCAALQALDAKLWPPGASAPLDWPWHRDSFASFTTVGTRTTHGDLDIVLRPDAPGGRSFDYDDLASAAMVIELPGLDVPVADLDHVIASKEAAGRDKDAVSLPMLRALRDERRSRSD